jgi:hypothetical protein
MDNSKQVTRNIRYCKQCSKLSVSWKGNWETCSSCGEVYHKRDKPIEELQDIVLQKEEKKGVKYFNKARFFFIA